MKTGIIGGSGIYDIEGLKKVREKKLKTPFGSPSDSYVCGELKGCEVFFLPRHGRGHRLLPSEINHRANIFGFKLLGVERVVSISAVGSLKEELRPEDIVLPDQYFDRTKRSAEHTFFGNGIVAHVQFGEPTCALLRKTMADVARKVLASMPEKKDVKLFPGGIYVNMEGPAFSTKAEAHFHRKMGFDVVGMTSLAEAKLCREAGICYQAMAMVTDYDCWHESEDSVTVEMIVKHLMANADLGKKVVTELMPALQVARTCGCADALQNAIITAKEKIPAKVKKALKPIIGKYV